MDFLYAALVAWLFVVVAIFLRLQICLARRVRPARRRCDELFEWYETIPEQDFPARWAGIERMKEALAGFEEAGEATFHPIRWYRKTGKFL